ncbi:hydrogenase maturation nickel metallochaperone HypA [Clostridium estertheticum]|nr:hydrogenase maturation nickel metallochaperone HypA [Clostridium estertheticum]
MHEYSITCEIIRIAECNARENGALKILKIGIVIGEYSGFIGESIQMYFDVISFVCSDCGGMGQPTDIGREFYVEYIEVES